MIEICTSHFNEDLEWLKKSEFPVTVIHHEGGSEIFFENVITIPNKGREASAYLTFIINRYENLPEFTAFIHGHEKAYHQLGDRHMLDMIRDANIKKHEYVPLNNNWRFINSLEHLKLFEKFIKKTKLYEIIPPYYITDSGAQFIVSKKLIKNHSKKYYEDLLENHLMYCDDENDSGVCLEFVWNLIFDQGITFPIEDYDYFDPPIKTQKFWSPFPKFSPHIVFINCNFEYEGILNVKSKEEYDGQMKEGSFFILFGNGDPDFEIEPPILRMNKNDYDILDVKKIIHIVEIINIDMIKDLMFIKEKYGRS